MYEVVVYNIYHRNKFYIKGGGYETTDIFDIALKTDDSFLSEYFPLYATEEPARKYADEINKKVFGNSI